MKTLWAAGFREVRFKSCSNDKDGHEHKFGDGLARYEPVDDATHHDHLICIECGRIQESEEPLIEELQDRIAERYGIQILDHKHELYGVCNRESCRKSALAKQRR